MENPSPGLELVSSERVSMMGSRNDVGSCLSPSLRRTCGWSSPIDRASPSQGFLEPAALFRALGLSLHLGQENYNILEMVPMISYGTLSTVYLRKTHHIRTNTLSQPSTDGHHNEDMFGL